VDQLGSIYRELSRFKPSAVAIAASSTGKQPTVKEKGFRFDPRVINFALVVLRNWRGFQEKVDAVDRSPRRWGGARR
jgi:hypothetical protein